MNWLELATALFDAARATTGLAVNWFIQSTLLVGGGLTLGCLLRERGSAVQSAVYRTTLIAVLACPFATWGLSLAGFSGWSLQMPEAYQHEPIAMDAPTTAEPIIASAVEQPAAPLVEFQPTLGSVGTVADSGSRFELNSAQLPPSEENVADLPPSPVFVEDAAQPAAVQTVAPAELPKFSVQGFGFVAAAAGALWLAAGGFLMCGLGFAWWKLHRLRRSAWSAESPTLDICHELAALLDVSPPDVLHSPYLPSPCLAGLRRPAVLLPESELSLPVRDVLVHELAHLRRHDCWWNLFRRVATALLFFQPLLWKLSRRLDSTAEEVCDDYVVQLGGDRRQYAHRLVDIAELSLAPAAAAGVGIVSLRSMLATRVARIMDTSRSLSTRAGRLLLALVLLVGLVATLLVGLVGIKPDPAAAESPNNSTSEGNSGDEPGNTTSDDLVESDANDLVTVRGQVVDPNGRAVPHADVYALRWFWDFGERKPLAQVKADDSGRFEISYSKSQFFDAGRPEQWREAFITAFAEGFGPGWITYGELRPGEEPTLRLVSDNVPIDGRIVDLEGHPVAGATIEMGSLNASKKEDLSDWLAAVRAGQSISTAFKHLGESIPAFSAGRWQGITTDSEGRFRMTGIGRERQVRIHVKHPSIVTKTLSVVTRDMEPLSQPAYDFPRAHDEINYGARFEFAAAPSRPIEGVVRDAKTREPISGVEVWSSKFAGENISGISTIKTQTDDQGRYRLEGMPKGEGNEIYVVPVDLPFFTTKFEVPDPPGIDAAKLNIELHRGQWITGRVTDKETGRGVSARMYYIVTPDNPIAPTLPEIADATHIVHVQDRYRTNADGSYRVVGLPGRGIVAAGVMQGAYPGGQGYEAIADRENRDGYMKFNSALSPGEKFPTAMKEVQVPEGDDGTVCDFELESGRRVTLHVVDPAGRPLGGVEVQGIREVHDNLQTMDEATLEIIAMRNNEARTVLLHHKERGLGKALRVKAAEGEAGPITVKLEPLAKVTGRLVDADGEPVRGAHLRIDVSGDGGYGKNLPGTATDSDGRFQHDGFLPGLAYNILAEGANIEFATVARKLEVQPGDTIDVGTIDITSDERPEPMRMAARDANRHSASGVEVKPNDSAAVEASGRVLTYDGKPAKGAEIQFAPRFGAVEFDLAVRATADADGRFSFTFPRSDLARLAEGLRAPWSSPYIVARMSGSGPVRKHIVEPTDAKDITLQLVRDDVPIEGRIVDLEGQPVANAVLRILRVGGHPNGQLDSWIQNLSNFGEFWNNGDVWLEESISQDVSGLPATVRTDAEGRFTLRGMGRERVVDFRLEAPRLESTEISVMSRRDGAITVPLEKENPGLGTYVLYNSSFTHSAAPSQPVEGVVRDADSGEPIAGVTLYCEKRAGRDIHGRYPPETKTDERGRYVLNGLPKGADNEIAIVPPAGKSYVPQNLVIDTSRGLETKTVDVNLRSGALIRGRVTDEATAEPVAGARVEYFAAIANESLNEYPGFRDADDITTTTGSDGRYEIVGLPGRGFLAIRATSEEFAAGQRIDVNQNDYEENPGQLRDTMFRTHPHTCIAEQHHAVVAVEIPADKTEFTRDVALNRGVTRRVRILDPDGNPLVGVEVNRRGVYACEWYGGDVTLDSSEFTVYGLDPGKPRSLFLKHKGRGLVGAFVVAAETQEPFEMRLQPAGSLVGRVVDEDGKPIAHTTLYGKLADGQGELDGFFFRASTNDVGRFRVPDLIPGLKYQMRYQRSGREYMPLKPAAASTVDLSVDSGQVHELGDLQAFDPRANLTTSAPQNAAEPSEPKKAARNEKADDPAKATSDAGIEGLVIGPDGKPVKGAEVYWLSWRLREQPRKSPQLVATADADGIFRFTRPAAAPVHNQAVELLETQMIAVTGKGFGLALVMPHQLGRGPAPKSGIGQLVKRLAEGVSPPPMISLPADDVPLRGRIVDIDGAPVAGAKVRLREISDPKSDTRAAFHGENVDGPDAVWRRRLMDLLQRFASPQLSQVISPVTTDADGRFTFRGLGRDRLVELLVEGERIESTLVLARTENAKPIRVEPDQNYLLLPATIHGAEFTQVAGPSKPLTGRAIDLDTGEPIAGAMVRTFKIHSHPLHTTREREYLATTTDAEGRYRISGLPIGNDNKLVVLAPQDQPYVPVGHTVDTSADGSEIQQDFRMKRGVWAQGRVYDAQTNEALTGKFDYYIFRNPKLESEILGLREAHVDEHYFTDADGNFRIPVLRTRGVLAFWYSGPKDAMAYPRGAGAEEIEGAEDQGEGTMKMYPTLPHYLIADNYWKVAEVNPSDTDEIVKVDMALSSGRTATVRVTDASGRPLNNVDVHGKNWGWEQGKGPDVEVIGLQPGQPRKVLAYHPTMKLAGAATISDTAAEPVSINLTASGTVRGRLVDEDGEPIGNAKILPDYEAFNSDANAAVWPYQPGLVMNPTQIPVNKDGTFEIVGLVPSWKYSASAVAPQDSNGRMMERGIGYVFEDITVESGQTVDLGDVQPVPYEMRRSKPKEPAADKPTAQEQTTSASKNSESSDQVLIRGRVTGPDGKPAAGAHVAVVASSLRQQRGGDLGRGDEVLSGSTTDANGQFQLTLSGVSSKTHRYAALVARAEGSALAWQRLNLDDAAVEVSLELAAEGPIRGRLVDIEGRPAGGVRLHYRAVMPTSKDGKFEDGVGFRELDKPAAAWPQPITSDADGNFVLPGIAAGQGVWLAVEASDRFAPQDVSLNTGMPEQRGERDGTYRSQVVRNLKPGEEPVLALAPAQIFEGVVTYEDTGKPAPHARLTIWASQQKFGSMVSVPGKADAQGRYRISPSPGIRFGVTAYPPDGAPYLTRELPPVDWEDAATVKKVDVTLPRGVMVRGRVIDATTGRPVPDATVQYVPEEANNPNDADDILTGWQGIQLSNDEGEFEIVTLPGPGNLLIHGPAGEFILQESSSSQLSRGTPGGQRRYAHAFERIESQAGGEAIDLTIELQPAKKVAGRIVDESGAPIDEALMITRLHITPHSPFWRGFPVELLGGRFELGGLASGEQYPTHFLDPKRRLGATAGLKAEDSEPTVVLKPCGQATARFIDPEGQPLDGFSPTLEMIVAPGAHRYDLDAMKQGELAADTDYNANIDRTNYLSGRQTDNDGRVTFPALIPGATYRIGRFDDGKGVIVKDFSVGSGESLDLGDIVMRLEN